MLIRLEHGRNYFWLALFLLPLCWLLGTFGEKVAEEAGFLAGAVLPILWLTFSEWRSGVVLDSWWTATYLRGTVMFALIIFCQILIPVLLLFIVSVESLP
jgi:hypothetical protein